MKITPQSQRFRSLFWFAALSLMLGLSIAVDRPFFSKLPFFTDFRAFYCAGLIQASGNNPYKVEPLRSCEHRLAHEKNVPQEIAVPAPLPGYGFAFFSLFTKLAFYPALFLWEGILLLAFIFTVLILTQLTSLEPEIVFCCFLLSDAMVSLSLGQIVPLAVGATVSGMWFLSKQKFHMAALCTALGLIEPHVGLGPCLSMLLFVPQARFTLLSALCALATLSLWYNTPAREYEYLHSVLPLHILSEIHNEDQYSLTHVLALLGARAQTAYVLGELSYLSLIGLSLFLAPKLVKLTGDCTLFLALPLAFITIGGPFLHIQQIAAALPAALILFVRLPAYRFQLGLAVFLLAVPWNRFHHLLLLTPLIWMICMLLSARFLRACLLAQFSIAAIAFIAVLLANFAFVAPENASFPPISHDVLAEYSWRQDVEAHLTSNQPLFLKLQLPTWIGLFLLAGSTIRAAQAPRGEST